MCAREHREPRLSPEERTLFETVGPILKAFARAHNLELEPWFKESAIWAMRFRHPLGGAGRLDLLTDPGHPNRLRVVASWARDDYDRETRSGAGGPWGSIDTGESSITNGLSQALREVLALTEKDLGEATPMPKGSWQESLTREQFEEAVTNLPVPRL